MNKGEIIFSGKKFISLKRASDISGYAKDYIGQLCRGGKIESRRIGRDWFVNFEDIARYKNRKAQPKIEFSKRIVSPELSKNTSDFFSSKRDSVREKFTNIRSVLRRPQKDEWEKELLGSSSKFDFKKFQKTLVPIASSIAAILIVASSFAYADEIKDFAVNTGDKILSRIDEISIPEIEFPEITLPEITLPEIALPEINFAAATENVHDLVMHISDAVLVLNESVWQTADKFGDKVAYGLSIIEVPEFPKISLPKITFPKITLPEIAMPDIAGLYGTYIKAVDNLGATYIAGLNTIGGATANVRYLVSDMNMANVFSVFERGTNLLAEDIKENVHDLVMHISGIAKDVADGFVMFPQNIKELTTLALGGRQPIMTEEYGSKKTSSVPADAESLADRKEGGEINKLKSELADIKSKGLVIEGPVVEKTIVERTVEKIIAGMTSEEIEIKLQQLNNKLMSEIMEAKNLAASKGASNFQAIALTQRIDNLSGVTINNPTFTGTITGLSGISVSKYLPLSGGTLSGALTGTAATFSGQLTISGTATNTIAGDTNFDSGTFYIDSINNRVGIGTTSPTDTLAINGPAYFAPISAPSVTTDRLYNVSNDLYWAGNLIGGAGTANWTLSGGNAYRATGNVGIGTTSPFATLSVEGGIYASTTLNNATGNEFAYTLNYTVNKATSGDDYGLYVNQTDTASPGQSYLAWFGVGGEPQFWVGGDGATIGGIGLIPNTAANSSGAYTGVLLLTLYNQSGTAAGTDFLINRNEIAIGSGAQYLIDAQVNSASKFSVTNTGQSYFAGNIGIGTTSPYAKLSVVGETVAEYFTATSTTATSTLPNIDTTQILISGDYITDFAGTNLSVTGGVLSAAGDGSSFAWTPSTTYNETASATTSPLWIQENLYASSTIYAPNFAAEDASATTTIAGGLAIETSGLVYDYSTNFVGIGTAAPSSKLTIVDGVILASGSTGGTPVSGAGTRMMWIPAKAAFRAGYIDGTQWDDSNVGSYSFASGFLTKSSGNSSFASGYWTEATGNGAIAMGWNTTASANGATAIGESNVASAYGATAFGHTTTASGNFAVSIGRYVTAGSSANTVVIGQGVDNSTRLVNNIASSLMIGFDSDIPTFYVGPSSGAGTSGNVGIGTTSPYAKLSVVGETVAEYFTATSTTATSTLPNIDTTQILISGDYITDFAGTNLSVTGGVLSAAGDGSSFAWTPSTTYNETASATTSPIWLQDTLYASSTAFFSDLVTFTANNSILLPQVNDAATPTLAFGDGDTGFYESGDDTVVFSSNGVNKWIFSGILKSNSTGVYLRQNASLLTEPSYSFNSDTDTGMISVAADQLSLIAGGVEVIRMTESGSNATTTIFGGLTVDTNTLVVDYSTDRVGIGTDSPVGTLEISGDSSAPVVYSRTNVSEALTIFPASGTTHIRIGGSNDLVFSVDSYANRGTANAGTERMRLTNAGNLGVGTTSPAVPLEVLGDVRFAEGANYNGFFYDATNATLGLGLTPISGTRLTLPQENDATTPTLAFGDGDTGFYESSDDSLQFTRNGASVLLFTANLAFTANGPHLRGGSPTATNPTVMPNKDDLDTGIGWNAADQLSLIAGGVEMMRFVEGTTDYTYTTAGNFGIGTSTPSTNLLHVYGGDAKIEGTAGNPLLYIAHQSTGNQYAGLRFGYDEGVAGVSAPSDIRGYSVNAGGNHLSELRFATTPSGSFPVEVVVIDQDGNVGIGNLDPSEKLNVQGTAAAQIFNATSTTATSTFSGGLTVDSTTLVVDYSSNKVGIGVANPVETFEVSGTLKTTSNIYAPVIQDGGGSGLILENDDATTLLTIEDTTDGGSVVITGGSLGIGTTSPNYALQVSGMVRVSGTDSRYYLSPNQNTSENLWALDNDAGTLRFFREDYAVSGTGANGSVKLVIQDGGNVGIASTSPWRTFSVVGTMSVNGLTSSATGNALCLSTDNEITTSGGNDCTVSSARFKNSIEDLDLGLADLLALTPRKYVYNEEFGGREAIGLIAEEVLEIDARLVSFEEDGTPRSVRYNEMSALLIKSIQDLNLKIEEVASSQYASLETQDPGLMTGIFDSILAWLEDKIVRVRSLFVKDKLCIGETCVTEEQLKALLANANIQDASDKTQEADNNQDTSNNNQTNSNDQNEVDTEPPVITLNGNNPAEIAIGSSYSDLGAVVMDNVDDNLGFKVSLSGGPNPSDGQAAEIYLNELSLDTSTTTTYIILFSAVDQAGNVGTTTREVNVHPVAQPQADGTGVYDPYAPADSSSASDVLPPADAGSSTSDVLPESATTTPETTSTTTPETP